MTVKRELGSLAELLVRDRLLQAEVRAAMKITVQPRVVNSSGGCGPNAGPQLSLSPAFSLK